MRQMAQAEKLQQLANQCEWFWRSAGTSAALGAQELRVIGDALYEVLKRQQSGAAEVAAEVAGPRLSLEDDIARVMGYQALAVYGEGHSPLEHAAYKRAATAIAAMLNSWQPPAIK